MQHNSWKARARPFWFVLLACVAGLAVAKSQNAVVALPLPAAFTTLGQSVLVDWTAGVIVADGRARAAAELSDAQAEVRGVQAARTDAIRVLAAGLAVLPITSGATLEQCMVNSAALRLRVDGLVKGALPVANSERVEKLADGSRVVSASLSVALNGKSGVLGAVLPEIRSACLGLGARVTGLIVDARGFEFKPCFAPRLVADDGVVWDSSGGLSDSPDAAGVPVVFSRSPEDARKLEPRVGVNPLLVKADGVVGASRCDVHLGANDLARVRAARLEAALARFRWVIVF